MTPAATTATPPPTAAPERNLPEGTGLSDLAALPELRLLPAPSWEPAYDDERGLPHVGLLPMLPPLRLLPEEVPGEDETHVVRTPRSNLPEPRMFAQALVLRLLEVVGGVRPVAQLRFDLVPTVLGQLEAALAAQPRPTGLRPTVRSVRSLHIQERPEGVAEVCATVLRGPRAAAIALRLEGLDGAWCCTELAGAIPTHEGRSAS